MEEQRIAQIRENLDNQINSLEIYKYHAAATNRKIREIEEQKLELVIELQKPLKALKEYKDIIDLICNYKYDDIVIARNQIISMNLTFTLSKINLNITPINTSFIKELVKYIIELNKKVYRLDLDLKHYNNINVEYKIHKHIIDMFNLQIRESILEGYTFHLGKGLSHIRVQRKKRTKANINWEESNKKKNEILARGGIPFNKTTAPDGEQWRVIFTTDEECWIYWNKGKVKADSCTGYAFVPSNGKNGFKSELRKKLKANPLAKLNFDK